VISQLGGVIGYGGTTFTQKEYGLAPFKQGDEVILLLRKDGNHWTIAGQVLGAFGVKGGKVSPLTTIQSFAAEYRDVPVSEMADHLVAQAVAAKQ
jgi:hypothetical protein